MTERSSVNLRQITAEAPRRLGALPEPSPVPGHRLVDLIVLVVVEAAVNVGAYLVLLMVVGEAQVVPSTKDTGRKFS